MPKPKSKSKSRKLVLRETNPQDQDPKDLEDFIREASEVKALTATAGWGILARDLRQFRDSICDKLPYLNPSKPEFRDSQILCVAVDKIFALVNDYQYNRDEAIKLLNELAHPEMVITRDVDTE